MTKEILVRSNRIQHRFRFNHGAEHMIERRRRNGRDQRVALAVELVVPAAGDGMAEIMPLQARQRRARFFGVPARQVVEFGTEIEI